MKNFASPAIRSFILLFQASISATTYTVTTGTDSVLTSPGGNPGELRYILNTILNDQAANQTPTFREINFDPSVTQVTLEGILPMINLFQGDPTLINGNGNPVTINGNGFRPFFIAQGADVTLENLTLINCAGVGGRGGIGGGGSSTNLGGGGGGGGMGAGGALFVDSATVTLNNVSFSTNQAVGGNGGSVTGTGFGAGGGGGLGGIGGHGFDSAAGGGGGYCGHGGNGFGNAAGGGGSFAHGGNSGDISTNNSGGGGAGAIIGATGGTGNGAMGGSVPGFGFGGGGAGGSADDMTNGGNGGGSFGGAGGTSGGGGGGGGFNGAGGDNGAPGAGGNGGLGGGGGGASGAFNGTGGMGGVGGGGGGAGAHSFGNVGGYGGGGGGFSQGGMAGGGGGGSFGFGGFGGGGGAGDFGVGGFGAGGGGGFGPGLGGAGGVGAGIGSTFPGAGGDSGGGGGAGFGGSIFVNTGTIILQGQGFFTGGSLTAGVGGSADAKSGAIAGSDIFLVGGAGLSFAPGGGQTISLSGSIADDSSTSVPGGNGVTPGGGAGASISKNGLGTLLLQGNSTYIGGTSLNNGTLIVNGQIIRSLTAAAGSILEGTGSVGDVALSGTLAPGYNSIGTLKLNSINFLSGSVFAVEVNSSGQSSLADVETTATVSGPSTIVVNEEPGNYAAGTIFKVLEAGSPVTGVDLFSVQSVDPRFHFLARSLSPNEVDLILQNTVIDGLNTSCLSGSRLTIANYLNTLINYAPLADVFLDLSALSCDQLGRALDTINPARNASAVVAAQNIAFTFSDIIVSRLANQRFNQCLEQECGRCFKSATLPSAGWVAGFGENFHQKSYHQIPSFEATSGGVLFGYDCSIHHDFLVGVTFGYAHIDLHQKNNFGKQTIEDFVGSIYSSLSYENFFIEGIIWGGYQDVVSNRNIFFPGFSAEAHSKTGFGQITPHLNFGYDYLVGFSVIEPFAEFDWAFNFGNTFKESGASPLNMEQRIQNSSLLRSETGLFIYQFFSIWDGLLTFREKIAYVNKTPFNTQVTASIIGAGGLFTVDSINRNLNLFSPSFEITYTNSDSFYISANYEGEYGSSFSSSTGFLELGKSF